MVGIYARDFASIISERFAKDVRRGFETAFKDNARQLLKDFDGLAALKACDAPIIIPHSTMPEPEIILLPWPCPYCGSINEPEALYCGQIVHPEDVAHCGAPRPPEIYRGLECLPRVQNT